MFDAGSSTPCPVDASSVCVDAAAFGCACGVAHQPILCEGVCVDPTGTEAVCALSPNPDPRCTASLDGGTGYLCDGIMRLACSEGYLLPCATLDCSTLGYGHCVDGGCYP